ncbi:hypothetical protein NKH18_27860 [Streptomyces sp. M10(2022)]
MHRKIDPDAPERCGTGTGTSSPHRSGPVQLSHQRLGHGALTAQQWTTGDSMTEMPASQTRRHSDGTASETGRATPRGRECRSRHRSTPGCSSSPTCRRSSTNRSSRRPVHRAAGPAPGCPGSVPASRAVVGQAMRTPALVAVLAAALLLVAYISGIPSEAETEAACQRTLDNTSTATVRPKDCLDVPAETYRGSS